MQDFETPHDSSQQGRDLNEKNVQLQVARRGNDLTIASYGQICAALWNTKPTLALFEEQRAALEACTRRYPGQTLFLCVVSASADPPDKPVRDASALMIKEHAADLLGCACVIEGTGFRAAITRSVLTGMTLLARTPVPIAFFERISGAAEWLRPRAGHPVAGLGEQLESLRKVAR